MLFAECTESVYLPFCFVVFVVGNLVQFDGIVRDLAFTIDLSDVCVGGGAWSQEKSQQAWARVGRQEIRVPVLCHAL